MYFVDEHAAIKRINSGNIAVIEYSLKIGLYAFKVSNKFYKIPAPKKVP